MPDAQQTIAAVLAAHERTGPPSECRVKHDYGCCEGCDCGSVMAYGDWAAHVAAEIDAALGGLARQWSVTEEWQGRSNATFDDPEDADNFAASIVSSFWHRFGGVSGAAIAEPKPVIEHRWVSGWTPEVAAR